MAIGAQQAVVLVHGLWMGRWSFASIDKYLSNQGYKVYRFGYATTRRPFDFNVLKLQAFVNSRPEKVVHLVVHSMGGLLSMTSLPKITKTGKLVMLGSPINGSAAAKSLNRMKWSAKLLNHAAEILENGIVDPQAFRHSMMIAGVSNNIAIGCIVTKLAKPHDGTVALIETQAEWVNHNYQFTTNHFKMLFHKGIQKTIGDFLSTDDNNQYTKTQL